MTALIKQSSTAVNLRFLLVLASDHITGATGVTPTVKLSKNGSTGAAPSGAVTEIDSTNLPGWYKIAGNATDTNTLGSIDIHATGTGCDPTDVMDAAMVVAFDPGDAVRLGLSALPNATAGAVNGVLISGTNAGTTTLGAMTVTGALTLSDGLAVTRTTANGSAITATGNGTGSGIVATSGAGATGDGIQATAASTNGNGLKLAKAGTGNDLAAATTTLALAKGTNVTGFNDIAATAIVSAGAINTSSGAVSSVTTVGSVTGSVGSVTGAVASVTGNVGGSVGGSVASVTAGVTLAAAAIDSAALATAGKNAIADAILDRDMSIGTDSGSASVRTVRQALRALRNKVDIPGGIVYKEDDATTSWVFSTTTAAVNPVTVVDPA